MPKITNRKIGLAFDMFGCPNRCRHCYLGALPNGQMTEDDVRRTLDLFRCFIHAGESRPFFESIDVVTWHREPDFSNDYRKLYELEVELSDLKTYRAEWELMSEWRVARDEAYAPWARSIGIKTCQTTYFGVGETQDRFYRRKGVFQDCLIATEKLLDAGIKPRWQFFLTKKIIPELDKLMLLVDHLKLRERCAELGGDFVMFIHTPTPEGEAQFIDHLRPTIDDVTSIPAELIKATERHFKTQLTWKTVGERVKEILASEKDEYPYAWSFTETPWFIIKPNWDVYSNTGTGDPWCILGNLQTEALESIMDSFEQNKTLPLHTIHNIPLRDLARRYGDPNSNLIDGGIENLWLAKYCLDHQ